MVKRGRVALDIVGGTGSSSVLSIGVVTDADFFSMF
jgi:hypothetical protein